MNLHPSSTAKAVLGSYKAVIFAVALLATPEALMAKPAKDWRQALLDQDRWLSLERASTGEKAKFRYYRYESGFDRRGYAIANHMLRDVTSGVTTNMNPKLIDLLFLMQAWLRSQGLPHHMIVNSGYRTPRHNASIAGAAKRSEHVNGNAADIRIPGLAAKDLDRLAKRIAVGGVGLYTKNGFVHVDVGRVRAWGK